MPLTRARSIQRTIACVAAVCLMWVMVPAAENGSIDGRVFSRDSGSVLEGAVVLAVNQGTDSIYESTPTGNAGDFELTGLPPGSYSLAVEVPLGVYLAQSTVALRPGESRWIHVTVNRQQQPGEQTPEEEPGQKPEEDPEGNRRRRTLGTVRI